MYGKLLRHQILGKNTSISLGDHFERFIQKEISTGRYSSATEEGERSGLVEDFDPKAHLEALHRKDSASKDGY